MSLPYTLTDFQSEMYRDVLDLYKPLDVDAELDDDGWSEGASWPVEATYAGVPGYIKPSTELLAPVAGLGQVDYDISDTMDALHLNLDQPIGANWYVQLKTPGHAEYGTWYVVQGDARVYHTLPELAHKEVFLKRATAPPQGVD